MNKGALLERLVRLGATDVPGTPRLLMKQRSPGELAALQEGVQAAGDRLKAPVQRAANAVASKLPGALQKPVRMLGDHPEMIPMAALPIPGASLGYLAAKKGAEGLIDKYAPLPKLAMDPGLMKHLQQTAGMGPALKLKKGIGQFAARDFNAEAAGLVPKRVRPLEVAADPFKQKAAERFPKGTLARVEGDALVIKKPDGTKIVKTSAGAPTRGGFMMASDIPAFRPPRLDRAIQKDSAFLPDNVTYSASDFKKSKYAMDPQVFHAFLDALYKSAGMNTPASQLEKAQRVGAPKVTAPPGPSIADQVKPRGARWGIGIPGAFKNGIGGFSQKLV